MRFSDHKVARLEDRSRCLPQVWVNQELGKGTVALNFKRPSLSPRDIRLMAELIATGIKTRGTTGYIAVAEMNAYLTTEVFDWDPGLEVSGDDLAYAFMSFDHAGYIEFVTEKDVSYLLLTNAFPMLLL